MGNLNLCTTSDERDRSDAYVLTRDVNERSNILTHQANPSLPPRPSEHRHNQPPSHPKTGPKAGPSQIQSSNPDPVVYENNHFSPHNPNGTPVRNRKRYAQKNNLQGSHQLKPFSNPSYGVIRNVQGESSSSRVKSVGPRELTHPKQSGSHELYAKEPPRGSVNKSVPKASSPPVRPPRPKRKLKTSSEEYRVLQKSDRGADVGHLMISIDIGISASGYAYSISGSGECCINRNWAEAKGYTSYKAPTAFCSHADVTSFGFEALELYEELADSLDESQLSNVLFYQSAFKNPFDNSGWNDVLISGVIFYLLQHCCDVIKVKCEDFHNFNSLTVLVTIAGGLQRLEGHLLKTIKIRATELTGLRRVAVKPALMTECELNHCLASTENNPRMRKDRVLIISTGGGHVEGKLFTAMDESKTRWRCSQQKQWKDIGSQNIDQAFITDIGNALGMDFLEALYARSQTSWCSFMETFVNAKSSIGPNTKTKASLSLTYFFGNLFSEVKGCSLLDYFKNHPTDGFTVGKDGKLVITAAKMKSYFDEVLQNLRNLLEHFSGVITNGLDGPVIYLIGGLAESPLVKSTVMEILRETSCELVIPEDSTLCGIKGALLLDSADK